jgi:lysophospholipid acyltransferase 7
MTLKIIGLAFERDSVLSKIQDKSGDKESVLTSCDEEINKITLIDMFHYCFNYIGLLTGGNFL